MCVNNTHHTHGTLTHCHLFLPKKTKTRNSFFFSQNRFLFLSAKTTILTRNISTPASFLLYLACHPSCLPLRLLQMRNARERNDKRSFSSMSDQQNNKSENNRQAAVCTSEYWSLDIKQTNRQTQPFS